MYQPPQVRPSEITPEGVWQQRRRIMQAGALTLAGGALSLALPWPARALTTLGRIRPSPLSTREETTPWKAVTHYNNYYEFGTDKEDPAEQAAGFQTDPWSLRVDGAVHHPRTWALEDLLRGQTLEERIYRLRCVEGWSMVIPWVGFPLADLLRQADPTGKAKYVAFETLYDPKRMPGQRWPILKWPYREGLRLDEAMHPLTILAVGLYGKVLPNQNGAPIRLVVPWKYGFKSIKAIVRIRLVEEQPPTTWSLAAPREYGFYANVNPEVDHPRWSQRRERRIGEFFKRKTLMFNGYAEQVAGLYRGMDLKKYF